VDDRGQREWQLELRGRTAHGRALTPPGFGLRELLGADARGAIVEASAEPTMQDVWRIPLDGGPPVRLSDATASRTAWPATAAP